MERVDVYRRIMGQFSGGAVGLSSSSPRSTASARAFAFREADIMPLPFGEGKFQELQIMDPDSPDFGKFIFIPNYSIPNGEDVVL